MFLLDSGQVVIFITNKEATVSSAWRLISTGHTKFLP